jgi:hypothetical protein
LRGAFLSSLHLDAVSFLDDGKVIHGQRSFSLFRYRDPEVRA